MASGKEGDFDSENGTITGENERMKNILSQMKSFMHSAECEIGALKHEMCQVKHERDMLQERLLTKDIQLAVCQQQDQTHSNTQQNLCNEFCHKQHCDINERYDLANKDLLERNEKLRSGAFKMKARIQMLERELDQSKINYDTMLKCRNELKADLKRYEDNMNVLKQDNLSLKFEVERRENKIEMLESKNKVNAHDTSDSKSQHQNGHHCAWAKNAEDLVLQREHAIEKITEDLKNALSENSQIKAKQLSMDQDHTRLKEEIGQFEQKLQAKETEMTKYDIENCYLKEVRSNLTTALQDLQLSLKDKESELWITRKELEGVNEAKRELIKKMEELEKDRDEAKHDASKLMTENQAMREKVDNLTESCGALEKKAYNYEIKGTELCHLLDEKEKYAQEMQVKLKQLKDAMERESKRNEQLEGARTDDIKKFEARIEDLCKMNAKLLREKKALKVALKNVEKEAHDLRKQGKTLLDSNEGMNLQIQKLEQQYREHEKISFETEKKLERSVSVKEDEVAAVTKRLNNKINENEELQIAIRKWKDEKGDLVSQCNSYAMQVRRLEERFFEKEQMCAEKEKNLDHALRESKQLSAEEADLRQKLTDCQDRTEKLRNELRAKTEAIHELHISIEEHDAENSKLKLQCKENKKKNEEHREKVYGLQTQNEKLEAEIINLKDCLLVMQSKHVEAKKTETPDDSTKNPPGMAIDVLKLQSELQDLKEDKYRNQTEVENLRLQLQMSTNSQEELIKSRDEAISQRDDMLKQLLSEVAKKEDQLRENGIFKSELAEHRLHTSALEDKLEELRKEGDKNTKKEKEMLEQVKNLDEELTKAKEELAGKENVCDSYSDEKLQLSEEVNKLRELNKSLSDKNELLFNEKMDRQNCVDKLITSLKDNQISKKDADTELTDLKEKYNQLLQDALALKQERDELHEMAHTRKQNKDKDECTINELQDHILQLDVNFKTTLHENDELLDELAAAHSAVSSLQEQVEGLEKELGNCEGAKIELEQKLNEQKSSLKQQAKSLETTVLQHNEKVSLLKQSLNHAETELLKDKEELNATKQRNNELKQQNQDLITITNRDSARLEELEILVDRSKEEIDKLREQMTRMKLNHKSIRHEKNDIQTMLELSEAEVKRIKAAQESSDRRKLFIEKQRDELKQEVSRLEQGILDHRKKIEAMDQEDKLQRKRIRYLQTKIKQLQTEIVAINQTTGTGKDSKLGRSCAEYEKEGPLCSRNEMEYNGLNNNQLLGDKPQERMPNGEFTEAVEALLKLQKVVATSKAMVNDDMDLKLSDEEEQFPEHSEVKCKKLQHILSILEQPCQKCLSQFSSDEHDGI